MHRDPKEDHEVDLPADGTFVVRIGGRPVLTVNANGVTVLGDLRVDGEIQRAFDHRKFDGRWTVIAGEAPGKENVAILTPTDGRGGYRLTYEANGEPSAYEYFLRFNPRTATLDCDHDAHNGDDHPDRSLSFWDGRARGGDGKHRIFAMHRLKEGTKKARLLPWEWNRESADPPPTQGAWGAEEGGG